MYLFFLCSASSSIRRLNTRRHTLLSNRNYHSPKPMERFTFHQLHQLLHPILFHQLDQPPLPNATAGHRHLPMAPQIHSLHSPIPPHQKPRRNLSANPRHRRSLRQATRQGNRNSTRRTQRQPRTR